MTIENLSRKFVKDIFEIIKEKNGDAADALGPLIAAYFTLVEFMCIPPDAVRKCLEELADQYEDKYILKSIKGK
jgi:hypothetical protein